MNKDFSKFENFVPISDEGRECFLEAVSFSNEYGNKGIGTLQEKPLHSVIKRFITPESRFHEVKITSLPEVREKINEEAIKKSNNYIADIFIPNDGIFEVQTGGFFPLKEKIKWYLDNTPFNVTLVHPIPYKKRVCWINPESGEVTRTKGVTKYSVSSFARELFWIKDFIKNKKFGILLILTECDDRRILDGYGYFKKIRATKVEKIPKDIIGFCEFNNKNDYLCFCPKEIQDGVPFTAKDFAKYTSFRGKTVYGVIKTLLSIGLVEDTNQKSEKSALYRFISRD